MKKFFLPVIVLILTVSFTYCSGSKKATSIHVVIPKLNYQTDIQHIVSEKCAPCHFPDKGGNKPPLNSYSLVSAGIDNIIARIQLHPGERGFMPFKRERISDSLINVFKQWKVDGLLEK
ncbi:MAG: cytochrome c [Ferruginibacter sp.]